MKKVNLDYYIMDWDNNILHLDTEVHLDYFNGSEWIPKIVDTSEFSKIRKNPLYKDNDKTYLNFKSDGPVFLKDCISAINDNKYGPSFNSLKKCLVKGCYLFIVTARGHNSDTIKSAIKYIIDEVLTIEEKELMIKNLNNFINLFSTDTEENIIDNYLNNCHFIGVYSDKFINSLEENVENTTENYKRIAVDRCVDFCIKQSEKIENNILNIGFSDDDINNLSKIKEHFLELKIKYPQINFSIFDTSNNYIIKTDI